VDDPACPFCGAPTPEAPAEAPACTGRCRTPHRVRLGRAALFAAGAALLGACEHEVEVPLYGVAPQDSGLTADAGSGPPDGGQD
jgi:hypothetical protein